MLDEAEARGVYVLAVTTTPKAWTGTKRLIGDRPRVRVALGLHPELVGERHMEVPLLEHFLSETRYVGEIGLDGSPHIKDSFAAQKVALARILKACANSGGRILTLHSRRAATPVLDALEAEPNAGTPILHWFSGTTKELERAVRIGCWFSVGPLMLKSEKGRALARMMPRDRVLTETDAPFAQVNGRPLMPWDVAEAYPVLAKLWGCEPEIVSTEISGNLRSLLDAQRI